MFGNRNRSYRELPLRLADFGVLHRNEFRWGAGADMCTGLHRCPAEHLHLGPCPALLRHWSLLCHVPAVSCSMRVPTLKARHHLT